jgi:hypothetical protein
VTPEVGDTSYEGGDGGSPGQASPTPDRDRPAVGTETGEIQRQSDAVDQERLAPVTGAESDNPRLPSPPEAPLTPEEAEAFENREAAEGSTATEDSPLNRPPDQSVGGVVYHPVWDADFQVWDFVDDADRSIYSTVISPDGESDRSAVVRFWNAVDAVRMTEQAKAITDDAVARLLRDQGPKLAELQTKIEALEKPGWQEGPDAQTTRLNALEAAKAERQELLDAYDPSKPHSSQLTTATFVSLEYGTKVVPLPGPPRLTPELLDPHQGAEYAPNFQKDGSYRQWDFHPAVLSSVEDAYAFNIQVSSGQVHRELDRIASMGYTEIHVATGTHGSKIGELQADAVLFRADEADAHYTMEKNPGLRIILYDMGDPVQASSFDALQALAAKGELPGGATYAAFCFSRTRVQDPDPGPAPAYDSVEVLDVSPLKAVEYARAGLAVGFGALSVYDGAHDPNEALGALKIVGGSAQVVGGASSALGYAIDSIEAVRFGSKLGNVGGAIVAPLVVVDVFRDMRQGLGPPLEPNEAFFKGVDDGLKLAGLMYPEAAIAAIAVHFGLKPVAEKGSEYLTPFFVRGISEVYGIPERYVWGMF